MQDLIRLLDQFRPLFEVFKKMDIILQEQIQNLGALGDKVSVKAGFARNFLIPKGFAVPATKANIANFEKRRAELEKKAAEKLKIAESRKAKIQALEKVVISCRAGEEGKLFGSIGTADIATALVAAGCDLAKKEVQMPEGPLRHIGESEVNLHLHPEVNAIIIVSVVAE